MWCYVVATIRCSISLALLFTKLMMSAWCSVSLFCSPWHCTTFICSSENSTVSTLCSAICSWITLFIAMAPSLGFLGTVIGMVMAFDKIQQAGDISPTVVAGGMKVALITTIFGLVVALILQVFYNYILSKIEGLTSEMEDSSITLLDMITKYNLKYKK